MGDIKADSFLKDTKHGVFHSFLYLCTGYHQKLRTCLILPISHLTPYTNS